MSWDAGAMVGRVVLDYSQYTKPLRKVVDETKAAQPVIAQALANPLRQATTAATGLENEMGQIRRSVNLAGFAGASFGVVMTAGLGMALNAGRSLLSVMTEFAMKGIQAAATYESTLLSFETMVGSASKAAKLMEEIKQFAASTPFELPTLSDATKKLLAYGVAAENIIGTLGRLGDLAAVTEKPLGELADIYGKVMSKGKMQAEEMNQFIERGIPIARVLAEAYGRSTEEIMKMASEGRIGFAQLDFALRKLTDEGGMAHRGMERLSKGLGGLWSTLSDEWSDAQRQFGIAFVNASNLKAGTDELTKAVSELKIGMRDFGAVAGAVIPPLIGWMKEFAAYARAAATDLGLIDIHKSGGNPYKGNDPGDKLSMLPRSDEAIDKMKFAMQKMNRGASDVDTQIAKPIDEYPVKLKIETAARDAIRQAAAESAKALSELNEANAATMTDDQFKALRERFQKATAAYAAMQEQLNKLKLGYAQNGDDLGMSRAAKIPAAQERLREGSVASSASMKVLEQMAKDAAEAKRLADAFEQKKTTATNPPPPLNSPSETLPPLLGDDKPGKSNAAMKVPTWRDMIEEMTREAEIIRAQSEGRIADAEKLRLKQWFDGERAKVATLQERIALEVLAAAKMADIEKGEADRKKAASDKAQAEADRAREEETQNEKRAAAERERLYEQLIQRQRGDLSELDQLIAADRAAAYASQSRLITYGPQVTSSVDRHLGSPTQPARALGAEPSPAKATADALAPMVGELRKDVGKINDNVTDLTRITAKDIEQNTRKQIEVKVVKF